MQRTILTATLVALMGGGTALAASNDVDKAFMVTAIQSGIAETQDAQLAEGHTSDMNIKHFGQRMIKDHAQADTDLKTIVIDKEKLTLPSYPSKAQVSERAKLGDLKGKAFDKAYMQQQIQAHQEAITAFEHESEAGADMDLRTFATKQLPMLRDHLAMAKAIKIPD